MDNSLKLFNLKNLSNTAIALNKNEFKAKVFENSLTAARHIIKNIGSGKTLGFGGSMTIDALNLKEKLKTSGNKIVNPVREQPLTVIDSGIRPLSMWKFHTTDRSRWLSLMG